jgi:hypothetical protein
MATPEQIAKFQSEHWPLALAVSQQTGVDPRIVMAQAAVESAWGTKAPNNNLFGIKDFSGSGSSQPTTEVVDGKTIKVDQPFAKYDSPAHAFGGYAQLIGSNERYRPFRTAPGYGAQIAELGKSGYATAPNYASVIDQAARGLTVPEGVNIPPLPMNVSGVGAGGTGVVAPTPDPRDVYTAPVAPADVTGQGAGNPMPGLLPRTDTRQLLLAGMANSLGQGLIAQGAPQNSWTPSQPMLQAYRPKPVPLPVIGPRGLLG